MQNKLMQPLPCRFYRCVWVIAAMLFLTGCNTFGSAKQVRQLQQENERLLAEFRAQRDRTHELQRTNAILEDRVADTEKQLALSYQPGEGRLSRRNTFPAATTLTAPASPSGFQPQAGYRAPSQDYGTNPASQNGLQWEPR